MSGFARFPPALATLFEVVLEADDGSRRRIDLKERLCRFIEGAHLGLTLDAALGLPAEWGDARAWHGNQSSTARRAELVRMMAENFAGSRHAKAEAMAERAVRYAGNRYRNVRDQGFDDSKCPVDRMMFELCQMYPAGLRRGWPLGPRQITSILKEGAGALSNACREDEGQEEEHSSHERHSA